MRWHNGFPPLPVFCAYCAEKRIVRERRVLSILKRLFRHFRPNKEGGHSGIRLFVQLLLPRYTLTCTNSTWHAHVDEENVIL